MSNSDRVLDFIQRFPGRDDDEIASDLAISPRQQVNQICRRLEREGRIRRAPGGAGKIVNYPGGRSPPATVAAGRPRAPRLRSPGAAGDDILKLQELGEDRLRLVQIALRHSLFPNPVTVTAFNGPVFPSIRDQRNRLKIRELDGRKLLLDDNVTPRWALLWTHGFSATHHLKGWTFAHIWSAPKNPDAYTHLANLCMMPEAFGSMSDKQGPLCEYLRYHAWDRYGWHPEQRQPERPEGYETLEWRYLPPIPDPAGFVEARIAALKNQRVEALRRIRHEAARATATNQAASVGRSGQQPAKAT